MDLFKKEKDEVLEKFIYVKAMSDLADFAMIALPVIAVVELILIFTWIVVYGFSLTVESMGYIVAFSSLTIGSVVTFILEMHWKKDCEKNYRKLLYTQWGYAILVYLWLIYSLLLDRMSFHSSPNALCMFFLINVTIVSAILYLKPSIWGTIVFFSAVILMLIVLPGNEYINASESMAYTVITTITLYIIYRNKRNLYEREYELTVAQKREEREAHMDSLTEFLNRRSYDQKVDELEKNPLPDDLVVVSMDVNALKKTNDTMGHKAGDELLVGAAWAIRKTFGAYGSIYRTGGDEFMALLNLNKDKLSEVLYLFNKETEAWKGEICKTNLSISAGFAFHCDYPELPLEKLEKTADREMYIMKRKYYEQRGYDRRSSR